jgi:hypothetical protein
MGHLFLSGIGAGHRVPTAFSIARLETGARRIRPPVGRALAVSALQDAQARRAMTVRLSRAVALFQNSTGLRSISGGCGVLELGTGSLEILDELGDDFLPSGRVGLEGLGKHGVTRVGSSGRWWRAGT